MYSYKVDDLSNSFRVYVVFVCGVLMMIFMGIKRDSEQSIGINFVFKNGLKIKVLAYFIARLR